MASLASAQVPPAAICTLADGVSFGRSRLWSGTRPRSRSASSIIRKKPGHRCGEEWSHVTFRSSANRTRGLAASGWLAGRSTPLLAQSTRRTASNPATGHWAMNTDATSMCPSRRARSLSASLMLDTRTCASGCASRNAARRSSMTEVYTASSPCANSRSEAPTLAAVRALVTARPAAVSVPRASTRNASPAGVSRIPRGRRWNSVTPTSRSRSRICLESAGCATRNRPAARRKLPSSATATKYRRWRSSTQVNPCRAVSTNRWMKPIAIPERASRNAPAAVPRRWSAQAGTFRSRDRLPSRRALERHITDEAAPAIAGAANQAEHAVEEQPDLGCGSPHDLERHEHRVHDGLGIAFQACEEQVPLAAERDVQAVAAGAGPAHQPVERRRGVPLPPKQLHGAVESFCGLECLGPRHASPPFKNGYSDITMPSRATRVNRSRGAPGSYRWERYLP